MALFGAIPKATSWAAAQPPPPFWATAAGNAYFNPPPPPPDYNPPVDNTDYGAVDSGGGGGDVAPFRPQLANDPAWLAYLNALGLQRNQFEADIARRRGLATADLARQYAALNTQGQYQREGIAGRAESTGFGRSGILEQNLARQRAQQATAGAGLYANVANQLGALETELAQKISDLELQRANREMDLRTSGYV